MSLERAGADEEVVPDEAGGHEAPGSRKGVLHGMIVKSPVVCFHETVLKGIATVCNGSVLVLY